MSYILIRGVNLIVDGVIAVRLRIWEEGSPLACTEETVFNKDIAGICKRSSHSVSLLSTKIFHCNPGTHSMHILKTKGIRYSSTQVLRKCAINPWFLTGFFDAESCFIVGLSKDSKRTNGWIVALEFAVALHEKEQVLLDDIRSLFLVGTIKKVGNNLIKYQVRSVAELAIVIAHFEKYPLITQKWADYQLFKQAFEIVNRKEHLSFSGLEKIISLKASINKGLSDKLKEAFPKIIPIQRPLVKSPSNFDPYWIAGFVSGEGCFLINLYKASTKLGVSVSLVFQITQHSRDVELMKSLISFFNCGRYAFRTNKNYGDFLVTTFSDVNDKIIPFFKKYKIAGVKERDFLDFCKASDIIKAKGHLTLRGLKEISEIKGGMNSKRMT